MKVILYGLTYEILGHNRLDKASKCRLEFTRSETMKYSTKDPLEPSFAEKIADKISWLMRLGKAARVEGEEEEEEEEADVSYYVNEEGKMVYIDDDGNEVELTQEELDLLNEADKEEEESIAASLEGSLEGSQVSKSSRVSSQVSHQSRTASRLSGGSTAEMSENGKGNKMSAAEKLRYKKEQKRLAMQLEDKLVEVYTYLDIIMFLISLWYCRSRRRILMTELSLGKGVGFCSAVKLN